MKKIVVGSIFFSILHSILFWNQKLGISMLIFVGGLSFYFYKIIVESNKMKNKKALFWLVPILLLSSSYFIFNNRLFRILNGFVIPILFIVMLIELEEKEIQAKGFFWNILGCFVRPINKIGEALDKIREKREEITGELKSWEKIKLFFKSVLIILPVIIIVLILLSSADESFASIFDGIGNFISGILWNGNFIDFLIRVFIFVIVLFYLLSFSYQLVTEKCLQQETKEIEEFSIWTEEEKKKMAEDEKRKGNFTSKLLLISLNLIYLVFVLVQIKNFILTIKNIDENFGYSSYARQGFFQLMIVSLINFLVLLKLKITKNTNQKDKKLKVLGIFLLVFTICLDLIAGMRMFLYEQEYGYTYLRLLVYFVLITEIFITIPIFISLSGKKINLFRSILIIISITYVVLNFINIDNLIARNNINRYLKDPENVDLDMSYILYSTGIDATEQKIRVLSLGTSNLSEKAKENLKSDQEMTRNYLEMQREYIQNQDRSIFEFNLSELKAQNLLKNLK